MFQRIFVRCGVLFLLAVLSGLFSTRLAAQNKAAQSEAQVRPATDSARMPVRFLEIGAGANAYRGDLTKRYEKWSSAVHIGLLLNRRERLNGHLNLAIGTLTGQNPAYQFDGEPGAASSPNRFFRTSFFTLNYDLHFNILKTHHWMVYVSQGIGIIRFRPKDDLGNSLQENLATRPPDEIYTNVSLVLPSQAGITYLLANGYGVGLRGGWLNQQTDYVDNISQWGNRKKKDNTLWVRFQFMVPLGQ